MPPIFTSPQRTRRRAAPAEMPTLPVELPKMPELKAPEVPECRQQ
jgi:hypothetical protein